MGAVGVVAEMRLSSQTKSSGNWYTWAQFRPSRNGPRLLHAVTYRFKGHVSVDPGTYRDPAEVAAARLNDPLLIAQRRLRSAGVTQGDIDAIDREAQAEIDGALQAAEAAPWPEAAAAYDDIMNSGAGVWK